MNNVIFGSGLVGLLAKALLPGWKVVPFARSRFFSFNPALDDNFIVQDERIDEAIRDIRQVTTPGVTHRYRRCFDVRGHLHGTYDKGLCVEWLSKIFSGATPGQSEPFYRTQMDLRVYDVRCNQLYAELLQRFMPEMMEEHRKGKVTSFGDHYFVRNGIREEFDHAICTIPLNATQEFLGAPSSLPTKDLHYMHVQTDTLNFEGFNQVLSTDPTLPFYKVTNVAPDRYLFYCHQEIPQPGPLLMLFIKNFEILDGTSVPLALPTGPAIHLDGLESKGYYCVGSNAQWDWCMDISSCILRLVRYTQRGFKPFQRVSL